jgi:DNA-binding NarL/FixJ family response regulator
MIPQSYRDSNEFVGVHAFRVLLAAPPEAGDCMASSSWARVPVLVLAGRAETESDAVKQFLKLRPDAIVLDWRLSVDEPARLIGVLRRMVADARVIAVVPDQASMPALAARAMGADVIVTLPDLSRTLVSMARAATRRR